MSASEINLKIKLLETRMIRSQLRRLDCTLLNQWKQYLRHVLRSIGRFVDSLCRCRCDSGILSLLSNQQQQSFALATPTERCFKLRQFCPEFCLLEFQLVNSIKSLL